MTSELQRQLSKIRNEAHLSSSIQQGRASLFLDAKEAAGVEIDDIFDAAISGLDILIQYDNRFEQFKDRILHPSSKSLQRELKTKEENQVIDVEIKKLLDILMLYAKEQSSHKIIEYLLRRYRCNEMNVDILIRSLLPYHNTKIFSRIVQLCKVSDTIWYFLENIKKSGNLLPRSYLVEYCCKDLSLLQSICKIIKTVIQTTSDGKYNTITLKGAEHILAFCTAVILEIIEMKPLDESQIRVIYPLLLEGLRMSGIKDSPEEQWRRASSMILCQLTKSSDFNTILKDNLLWAISKAFIRAYQLDRVEDVGFELILLVVTLSQYQQITFKDSLLSMFGIDSSPHSTSKSGGSRIAQHHTELRLQTLFTTIDKARVRCDVQPLILAVVRGLLEGLHLHANHSQTTQSTTSEADKANVISEYSQSLQWIITTGWTTGEVVAGIISDLIHFMVDETSVEEVLPVSAGLRHQLRSEICIILRVTGQRYSAEIDACIRTIVDKYSDNNDRNTILQELLKEAFSNSLHHLPNAEGASLLLQLLDTSAVIRQQALKSFAETIPEPEFIECTEDLMGLATAAGNCLVDSDHDCFILAWSVPVVSRIAVLLHPDQLLQLASDAQKLCYEKLELFPRKSLSALISLLLGCSSPWVITRLTSPDTRLEDGTTGADWLLLLVLNNSIGIWSSDVFQGGGHLASRDSKSTLAKKRHKLISVACQCASAVAASGLVELLKDYQEVPGNDQSTGQTVMINAFTAALLSRIRSSPPSLSRSSASLTVPTSLVTLLNLAKKFHTEIDADSPFSLSALSLCSLSLLLAGVCRAREVSDGDSDSVDESCRTLCLSALLSIRVKYSWNHIAYEHRSDFLTDEMLIELCKPDQVNTSSIIATPGLSPSDQLSAMQLYILSPSPASDSGFRVLLSHLSGLKAKSSFGFDTILTCLRACFPNNQFTTLLKVAVVKNRSELSVLPSDMIASDGGGYTLHVTDAARHGALYVLGALLSTVLKMPVDSITEDIMCILILLCPAMVAAMQSNYRSIRKAGIAIAKVFSDLSTSHPSILNLVFNFSLKQNSAPLEVTVMDLQYFGKLFTPHAISIESDESTVCAVLGAYVFGKKAEADGQTQAQTQALSLSRSLLWTVCEIGWRESTISIPIMTAASAVSLEASWPFIRQLVTDYQCRRSEYESKLAVAIMSNIQTLPILTSDNHSFDPNIREDISQWIIERFQRLEEGTLGVEHLTDDFMGILLKWLSQGWAKERLSAASNTQLFRVLIRLQQKQMVLSNLIADAVLGMDVEIDVMMEVLLVGAEAFLVPWKAALASYERKGEKEGVTETNQSSLVELLEEGDVGGGVGGRSLTGGKSVSMATTLQRLCNLLELLREPIHKQFPSSSDGSGDSSTSTTTVLVEVVWKVIAKLFDILVAFNHSALKSIITVEYAQCLLLDILHCCCNYWKIHSESNSKESMSSTSATPKKKNNNISSSLLSSSSENDGTAALLTSFTHSVLNTIQSARTGQVQRAALQLLKLVVDISPSALLPSLPFLGQILASASLGRRDVGQVERREKEALVAEVLQTFVQVLNHLKDSDKTTLKVANLCVQQEVLLHLFVHFGSLSPARRLPLVFLALSVLGDGCVSTCICLTLTHALAVYESEASTTAAPGTAYIGDYSLHAEHSSTSLVLLSRHAQRKAGHSLLSSPSEELLSLALDTLSRQKSSEKALHSLVQLVRGAAAMLEDICSKQQQLQLQHGSQSVQDNDTNSTLQNGVMKSNDHGSNTSVVFDLTSLKSYLNNLLKGNNTHTVDATSEEQSTNGEFAGLILLMLEFLMEALESKFLHLNLAKAMSVSEDVSSAIRKQLIELAEGILQLLALASSIQQDSTARSTILQMKLGKKTTLAIAVGVLAKKVWEWCMVLLQSLQSLLDPSSFVVILQELLDHEEGAVRQKALQILGQRLHTMDVKRIESDEIVLLLDLTKHLRTTISTNMSATTTTTTTTTTTATTTTTTTATSIALSQSALLCLDAVAGKLGKRPQWQPLLEETLGELVLLSRRLVEAQRQRLVAEAAGDLSEDDTAKRLLRVAGCNEGELLGSLFLCCATLFDAVGVRAQPHLAELIACILSVMESQNKLLSQLASLYTNSYSASITTPTVDGAAGNQQVSKKAKKKILKLQQRNHSQLVAAGRSVLLLLRSCMSAAASVVLVLSKFCHPFLMSLLTAGLSIRQDSIDIFSKQDSGSFLKDADRCLFTILSTIPPRLSIAALVQGTPTLLSTGNSEIVARFASVLKDMFSLSQRADVVTHLSQLFQLSNMLLDYRSSYVEDLQSQSQSQGGAAATAQNEILLACSELFFKLTENELKSILSRLAEWRDNTSMSTMTVVGKPCSGGGAWRAVARGYTFFGLLAVLGEKLQSILVPVMGPHWQMAVTYVEELKALRNVANQNHSSSNDDDDKEDSMNGMMLIAPKKSKKRQLAQLQDVSASSSSSSSPVDGLLVEESIRRTETALRCLTICCKNDSYGFVDEYHYNLAVLPVAALIETRGLFDTDDAYLQFTELLVIPCLTSLAVAVGKDLLWKPLNQKILSLTKVSIEIVKIVCLKALSSLFSEVGEEYLLLLPESLPFLSELMEDDSDAVTALTSELCRSIEELSGEKLDSYLQ